MRKVLTAAEMREVDRLTTEKYGISSIILMENAAQAVAKVVAQLVGGSVAGKSIHILCGKGNNGGDGAALARILSGLDARVSVELFGRISDTKGDARENFERLRPLETGSRPRFREVRTETEDNGVGEWMDNSEYDDADVVVDAIFGTGLTRELSEFYSEVIEVLNEWRLNHERPIVVSVDLPSGLSDGAEVLGKHIRADATVTFTAPKPANVLPPASRVNGCLTIADIGSPEGLIDAGPSQLFLAESEDAATWLERSKFLDGSYKNKRGHAWIVAGSENYSGAAVLAGNAAMRSGVGLVTIGTPSSCKESIAARTLPEVMVRPLAETGSGAVSADAIVQVETQLEKADAVAIGCGLSTDDSTRTFVRHFVENRRVPTILDADALTLLSPFSERPPQGGTQNDASLILTPHEGEFLRMLGTSDKEAIKDRVAAVREFSVKHGVILVLKGERVLIGGPDGKVVVNPTGNSGLGKAGNGDTLAGILAGFVAQAAAMGIDIFETVVAAVFVAGSAGDITERRYGNRVMTASDVRDCLTEVFACYAEGNNRSWFKQASLRVE